MPAAALRPQPSRLYRRLPGDARARPFRQRLVETRVRFKRLSDEEIEAYLASGEWRGKAGGYAARASPARFIVKLVGSYATWSACRSTRP